MTSQCMDEAGLLRLLDGEVTENEAERFREHLRSCAVCAARSGELERTLQELKAPLPPADLEAAVEEVMRRLPMAVADPAAITRPRPRVARWGFFGAGLAAVLAMTALLVGPRVLRPAEDNVGEFASRGGPVGTSLARAVGVTLFRPSSSPDVLAQDSRVRPDDAYGVRYTNLLGESVYLLAFAVDSAGAVHSICPAYLEPGSNPAAVALPPATTTTTLPSAMQLEAPSSGRMRFVAILSQSLMHVLDVDGLRGGELQAGSLQARWPTANVRELATVDVAPSP